MLRKFLATCISMSAILTARSQDSAVAPVVVPKLSITGSVDAYYRFNFTNAKDQGDHDVFNNNTSFTNSHNSFELGMASVKFDYTNGKVGVVADLGFGTRAEEFSYNDEGTLAAIKQAYITYAPSDKLKFTFGKFGTHVGYELLDPQLNRNYSMSYMFSYGPFFHTGLKADVTVSENFGFMVGIANPTDRVSADFERKYALAQVHATFGNVAAYLNYVGGKDESGVKGNQIDAVVTGKVSDKFSIGYNGTIKFVNDEANDYKENWWASAVYLNIDPTSKFGLTLRGEYFDDKKGATGVFGTSFVAGTLSFNIKPASNLTILPEFRLDSGKDAYFTKNDGSSTKSTASFILAAIVSF